MKEPVLLTVDSNVEPHRIDLTLSLVIQVLKWTKMEKAPNGRVRLRFSSGDCLTADREDLKRGIREYLTFVRGLRQIGTGFKSESRELLDRELGVRPPIAIASKGELSTITAGQLLAMPEPEPEQPPILIPSEAAEVATLAEQAGCAETARLLRFLCAQAGTSKCALLENLVPPSALLRLSWQALQRDREDLSWCRYVERQLQKLGGMDNELRSPKIYDAVVQALREDPSLTPKAFWDSIDEDGSPLYKSSNQRGQEVLKREDVEEQGITFPTLRSYFTRARKSDQDPPEK